MARIPAKKVEQVNKSSHFTTDINTDSIDFTTDKDKYTFDKECYIGTDKLVKESEVLGSFLSSVTTDTTLSGNGTATEPLKLSEPIKPKLVEFQGKTDWGNSGTSKTITEITTKMNFLTLTGNCVLTLPEFEYETECISFMIRVAQDSVGGRSLTINKSTGTAAINLSEFDFSTGTIGQYCWVTVLWDTEVLVFTSSKYI